MDAKELTRKYYEIEQLALDLKKRVEYLEAENAKLRLTISDLEIDVKMLEKRGG